MADVKGAAGKAKGLFGEFKQFIMRGNVLDMAVGVIIGGAFGAIVTSLVNDVINLIKMTSLAFMLGVPDIMGAAKIEGAKTFRYFEIYAAVMLVYWVVIFILGLLHKWLEKK